MTKIPRNKQDDYTAGIIKDRQDFIREQTGAELEHTARFSFDPDAVRGNIENFTGVVQMPLGLAGPMKLNGEHAEGDVYVPMATTEGTLVASYNRGMRLTREAGGITVSVVDDAMQRAPVFIFENARQARDFGLWVTENFEAIKAQAETTTSVGKLRDIEQYSAARMLWLRFNFTTGDAAGQNMVTKAAALGADILSMYVFCHYNYSYDCLRPTLDEIVKAYVQLCNPKAPLQRLGRRRLLL